MTYDDFISKWTNQPVDFDGVYPNQCMDLMHQYVYDVLGLTDKNVLSAPAAYQVYTNFSSIGGNQYFDQIGNTPDGVPAKGDIVLFGTDIGAYGHVCIFISGDQNSFTSFDANWPVGSLPHQQEHSYTGVLGWLHPKEGATDPLAACLAQHTELVTQAGVKDQTITNLTNEITTLHGQISDRDQTITDLNNRIQVLTTPPPATPEPVEPPQTSVPTPPAYPDLSKDLATCQLDVKGLSDKLLRQQQVLQRIKQLSYGSTWVSWATRAQYQIKALLAQASL